MIESSWHFLLSLHDLHKQMGVPKLSVSFNNSLEEIR